MKEISVLDVQTAIESCVGPLDTKITRSTSLMDLPDFDSLARLEMVMMLEKEINCPIPDHRVERMLIVEDVLIQVRAAQVEHQKDQAA